MKLNVISVLLFSVQWRLLTHMPPCGFYYYSSQLRSWGKFLASTDYFHIARFYCQSDFITRTTLVSLIVFDYKRSGKKSQVFYYLLQ